MSFEWELIVRTNTHTHTRQRVHVFSLFRLLTNSRSTEIVCYSFTTLRSPAKIVNCLYLMHFGSHLPIHCLIAVRGLHTSWALGYRRHFGEREPIPSNTFGNLLSSPSVTLTAHEMWYTPKHDFLYEGLLETQELSIKAIRSTFLTIAFVYTFCIRFRK